MVSTFHLKFGVVLLKLAGCRAFAIELPVAVLGFASVFVTVQLPHLPTQKAQPDEQSNSSNDLHQKMSFDVYGALTLSSFVITLVLALSMGGNDVPWAHPGISTLLMLSAVSFVAFAVVETRTAGIPLVPLYLVFQRSIWPLFAVTYFKDMAFMTVRESTFLFQFRSKAWPQRPDGVLAFIPHITTQ